MKKHEMERRARKLGYEDFYLILTFFFKIIKLLNLLIFLSLNFLSLDIV
jgi:hypothetical protein